MSQQNRNRSSSLPTSAPSKPGVVPARLLVALFTVAPALLGAKGCELANLGSDEVPCDRAEDCRDAELCLFDSENACGKSGVSGSCTEMPTTCRDEYDPVCGCDGRTYTSACDANSKGVSVAGKGECETGDPPIEDEDPPPSGNVCGGLTGQMCSSGKFCLFSLDARCGAADATGSCEPIPEACTRELRPVCGCDGRTYENSCSAHAAGVSVARTGECEDEEPAEDEPCGNEKGECDKGFYCDLIEEFSCDVARGEGICRPVPEVCTDEYDPVCGCDGETYSNACRAAGAGVNVASQGACGEEDDTCTVGGCEKDEFCNLAKGSGCSAEQGEEEPTGSCEPMPQACTLELTPVCGCDGNTYSNACDANGQGVSVDYEGDCSFDPGEDSCGGLLGLSCDEGTFCNYAEEALCGITDATGTCEAVPEACDDVVDPVCGCDGNTYVNACEAHASGVSVASAGECGSDDWECGSIAGITCEEGEFCDYEPFEGCEVSDGVGLCRVIPEICTQEFVPVCGCDGETYGNDCSAHSNGVSILHRGACEE